MFCNMVFNIVGFCSGAIVAVFALVWPFLLMLAFNVFFQRCSGTETLASTWGSVTYYWVSLLVSKPEVACKVRFSWLYNTINLTNIFLGTPPSKWWFLWCLRLICIWKGKWVCRCGGRVQCRLSIRRRNLLSTWLKHMPPMQRACLVPRSNCLQVRGQ